MTDFDQARKVMVDNQLRTAGITDRRLLLAMGEVPREAFVPPARRALAYIDQAVPLSGARLLPPAAPLAKLLQLAEVDGGDHVLDLGCGTGYSSAVLAKLAASVVAVETDSDLATTARQALAEVGASNVTVVHGALESAGKAKGPYDVIILQGVTDTLPTSLLDQLKPDGRIVALIAEGRRPAIAHLFTRSGKGVSAVRTFDAMLPRLHAPAEERFVF